MSGRTETGQVQIQRLQVAADLEVRGLVPIEFEVLDRSADARASVQDFERAGRAVEPPEFVSQ